MLEFDEATAKALEFVYGTRDVVRRRALVREALGAREGERILDVGCGPGFYVAELAQQVGGDGSVAGVDTSASMLAMARGRTEAFPNVELHEAPADALPFEDGSFDAAVSVQVLEYVDDVPRAIAELNRVVRPGGRIVLWDVDWETVSMYSADPARLRRVLAAWDRHLVHRSLPQTLTRLVREGGFTDATLTGHTFATSELTPDAYGGSLVGVIANYLSGLPDFPADERTGWVEEQLALGEAGEFYFACVQCCVTAVRGA